MKTFVQDGDTMILTVPDDTDHADGVASGGGVLNGYMFGFAVTAAAAGADVPCKTTGVFYSTKKASEAWTKGDKVYWDDTNLWLTNVAGSLKQVGVAAQDEESGAALVLGHVKLLGHAV